MLYNHVIPPMSRRPALSLVVASFATGAAAEVPRVAVDVAPVHSLVAMVMADVGTPDLVMPPGSSPHDHSLRPSEAAALQDADLLFWIGPGLTPWMEDAVETLADGAIVVSLLDAQGVERLPIRENALFEHADHGHGGEDEHDAEDDHGEEDGHDDHGHGADDPHAWLSPANAAVWLDVVADRLAEADPANADAYRANAAAGRDGIGALRDGIEATLAPVRDGRFVVFHDAYQYFEAAFDIPAAGALSVSDAAEPGPARLDSIQARIRAEGIDCVLAEPQFNPGLVDAVRDGTEVAVGTLDPLGSGLEPGPDLYPRLMRDLADALAGCLSGKDGA